MPKLVIGLSSQAAPFRLRVFGLESWVLSRLFCGARYVYFLLRTHSALSAYGRHGETAGRVG